MDAGPTSSEAAAQWILALSYNYVTVATFTLSFYEYLITLHLEISEIWHGRTTVTKVVFYLSRYSYLTYQVLSMLLVFGKFGDMGCNIVQHAYGAALVLPSLALAVIFTLRTFAIYERNWLILLFCGCMALAIAATNIWPAVETNSVAFPPPHQLGPFVCASFVPEAVNKCEVIHFALLVPHSLFLGVTANYALNATFDAVVFSLTIAKTIRLAIQAKSIGFRNSLGYLLARDGSLYYFTILLPSLAVIILTALDYSTNAPAIVAFVANDLNIFNSTLQWLLVNRLVLDLSHGIRIQGEPTSVSRTRLPEISFLTTPVLGNIGAPLRSSFTETREEDFVVNNENSINEITVRGV